MKSLNTLFGSLLLVLFSSNQALAKPFVLTSTSTIEDLVRQIAKDQVGVQSIAKGTQDPHYIEAKPSYMVQARKADLVLSVGLELEKAWLPNVLRGARNPKLLSKEGHLELGSIIQPLDAPSGAIDRSHGDVHPSGNPHFYLDPERVIQVIDPMAERLAKLSPNHKSEILAEATNFKNKLNEKTKEWQERIRNSGVKKVVTYHKTLRYFLDRFGIELHNTIEPKPGIPPSPKHIIDLIGGMKENQVSCILTENFFESTAANRISSELGIHSAVIATEVRGNEQSGSYIDLIDHLVETIENCTSKKDKAHE